MKIFAIADIHIEGKNKRIAYDLPSKLKERLKSLSNDAVLIILGDITPYISSLHNYLLLFKGLPIKKLFVAGNHDIWVEKGGNSYIKYLNLLKDAVLSAGFHYLDYKPFILNNIGFIGNIGWYDYSFRQLNVYIPPFMKLIGKNGNYISWQDLTYSDYARKALYADINGKIKMITSWNDRIYIRWNFTDLKFTELCFEKIKDDFRNVESKVDKIVFASHHIHFYECVIQKKTPEWDFNNAFMGSKKIGDFVKSREKVSLILFGHSHVPGKWLIDSRIPAYNPPLLINNNNSFLEIEI
ncbi:MAG TPA: metallophosphoesterase [Caldisericia bacterium]|nr:metallophosphoesterase [Caldisericia bacterium]HXK70296.1 metallophosphoesterase [Caldisericia bacterium]